ncbi:thioredoxin domain-containing protein [Natroniella sulfidigena]|uniref:thioredoxin domain-containing protein n=1 Tax=Natroniella sulfidigena TaxID=723921 RepID=UPI00200B0F40|nr:thioredoxin domain-containing protein [Natroniella sulfidigena]MCK8816796.1 thioredoxin domain-containing protein [Natroniella sulfidigena]
MPTSTEQKANHLIDEKSPYLLQHAYNPVDWYPWDEKAFAKAEREDKPIFLSIGYSTCHWCHVMEEESFEDEEVAEFLNEHFVSIKVDREERPDVDNIYMKVCQALTGRGGWPLTVVMTPDKEPFFAGTYFPKESRMGRPGLLEILRGIQSAWEDDRSALLQSSSQIMEAIKQKEKVDSQTNLSTTEMEDLIERAYQNFKGTFDREYGGFGSAPKFPLAHNLLFLMRYWKLSADQEALDLVTKTLDNMYAGGIYDHLGYGFARYSTDRKWLVPHFEKMLYDNALLAIAYLEAYQITDDDAYARVAEEILTYVSRDMTSTSGGFYSAEDADSEGVEGKFYVWTPAEIKEVLGDKEGEEFCQYYDITEEGNFEGKSIPNLIGQQFNKAEVDERFKDAREKLFAAREKRVHPDKDDKILTGWNGLMIAAMSLGARVLGEGKYQQLAQQASDFLWENLYQDRLLARYRAGEAAYLAYADDYAFLIWGLLELYQTTFNPEYLKRALLLNDELLEYFWDDEAGGLYFYGEDGEELITRPKEVYDGAMPSGNSVATLNFLKLAKLTGDNKLEEKVEEQISFFGGQIKNNPTAYSYFLLSILSTQAENREVVIVAEQQQEETEEMLEVLRANFTPFTTQVVKTKENAEQLLEIVPFLADYQAVTGQTAAYICQDFTCQAPITDLEELKKQLIVDN